MPIERYSEMPDTEPAAEAPEAEQAEAPMEEATASLPMSLLAGKSVAPGDVVRLEVVGVDDEGGNVTVKYASEPPVAAADEKRGLDGMAAAFD